MYPCFIAVSSGAYKLNHECARNYTHQNEYPYFITAIKHGYRTSSMGCIIFLGESVC